MSTRTLDVAEDAAKEVYGLRANVQASAVATSREDRWFIVRAFPLGDRCCRNQCLRRLVLDMRYAVVFLVWLSGVTSAGTLTLKLRLAQESHEQCTNGCDSGYDACIRRCPLSVGRVSCTSNCQAQLSACNNRCSGR
jgi:hypothetical protein